MKSPSGLDSRLLRGLPAGLHVCSHCGTWRGYRRAHPQEQPDSKEGHPDHANTDRDSLEQARRTILRARYREGNEKSHHQDACENRIDDPALPLSIGSETSCENKTGCGETTEDHETTEDPME